MVFTIDFNSNEAIYMQLCNQIILGIANAEYRDGDSLPSVRQMAEIIGINMHTVNKAYSVLRQEGYIKLDRRHGAVISLDTDRILALEAMNEELKVVIGEAISKNITPEEIHAIVDEIIARFTEG